MSVSIKIEGLNEAMKNMNRRGKGISKIISDSLKMAGLLVERESKLAATRLIYNTPPSPSYRRTGRLRSSIMVNLFPTYATVVPNVKYAVYVHEGTIYMDARPFMDEGLEAARSGIIDIFEKNLKKLK